jgi:hypothetical protein
MQRDDLRAVQVAVRVQHHPSRAEVLPRLLDRLADLPVEVIEHESEPPNPLHGYLRCLSELPEGCSHLLVIQDDAIVCQRFSETLPLLLRDVPVCLFLGHANKRTRRRAWEAMKVGGHWVELAHSDLILPTVAVLWPVVKITQFLDWWAEQRPRRVPDKADDGVLGRWMAKRSQKVLATLPSLVEHPDDVYSFVKLVVPGFRHAIHYIGDSDPLAIDWEDARSGVGTPVPRRRSRRLAG